MTADGAISVFGLEDEGERDRGLFKRASELQYARNEIPTAQLSQRLDKFVNDMGSALSGAHSDIQGYRLEEVVVSAEISASGSVAIMGCGGTIGGKGAIEFKFVRTDS